MALVSATTSWRAVPRASGDTAFRSRAETSFEGSLMTVRPDESKLVEAEDLGTGKEGRGTWVGTEA